MVKFFFFFFFFFDSLIGIIRVIYSTLNSLGGVLLTNLVGIYSIRCSPLLQLALIFCFCFVMLCHRLYYKTNINPCPAEPGYNLPLQRAQIQISWLLKKPTDLDLHCLPLGYEFIATIWIK